MKFSQDAYAITRGFIMAAALIVVFAGVKSAQAIVVPFLLSVFIAIICQPLILMMEKYRIPKGVAVLVVVALVVSIGLTMAGLVGQSMNQFSNDIPQYKTQLQGEFDWLAAKLANFNINLNRELLLEHLNPSSAMSLATNLLSGLGNVMTDFFLILLTSIFMLFEAGSISKKMHLALDDASLHLSKIDQFLNSVKHYLAIKTVVSLLTGFLAGLLCYFIGVDYFILWAALAFLLNYIPTIGSIIAAVPAVLLALIQVGPAAAGATALGYVAINTIVGNVIEPKYMGKGLGLSTLVVFLSLVFWGWLLGTVGMLLSVPLTMVVKIALESTEQGNWFAVLLTNEEEVDEKLQSAQVVEQQTQSIEIETMDTADNTPTEQADSNQQQNA